VCCLVSRRLRGGQKQVMGAGCVASAGHILRCATISTVLAICVSFKDSTGNCNLISLLVDWVIMESNFLVAMRAGLMLYGEAT
jgi:hypothetical protein